MVDVGHKPVTTRSAKAQGTVQVGSKITRLIKENGLKKGDVLSLAQMSGILGAKQTSNLIPLCHNIMLNSIKVSVELNEKNEAVVINATVNCDGKTGVEMEALTAVSVAALTVYDMCKAVSHDIVISDICLLSKSGGTRGNYDKVVNVRGYETTPISKEEVCLGTF